MGKCKVEFDREACIGSGACVASNGDWWSLDSDGKAVLRSSQYDAERKVWVLDVGDADFPKHLDAAKVCPVNAIHVYDEEKKLI